MGLGSDEPLITFSLIDPYITLFYVCVCLAITLFDMHG